MNRLIALALAAAFSATASAQTAAPAASSAPPAQDAAAKKAADRKAKQEMVQSTTEKAATQYSVAPNRGPAAPHEADKMSKAERKEVMKGAAASAGSQYGPSAGTAATKVDKSAPKAARPDMSDPKVEAAMQKASKQ
jgi:hypothetical protein